MIEYVRDVPRDSAEDVVEAEKAHVRAHLSAVAAADDDPETHAGDAQLFVAEHPDDPVLLRIKGMLDAEPDAPYLRDDFDAFADIDPALLRAAGL